MSRRRKLSPEAEAALIAWYAQYQAVLEQMRKVGSIHSKARELSISTRTVHTVVKRQEEKARRVLQSA